MQATAAIELLALQDVQQTALEAVQVSEADLLARRAVLSFLVDERTSFKMAEDEIVGSGVLRGSAAE